jgi:hypothetical protein
MRNVFSVSGVEISIGMGIPDGRKDVSEFQTIQRQRL